MSSKNLVRIPLALIARMKASVSSSRRVPSRYRALIDLARKSGPRRILEIGTWNGNNARRLIEAAGQGRGESAIEYYGFDLFEDMDPGIFSDELSKWPPSMKAVEKRLTASGAEVFLFKGNTKDTLPAQVDQLPPMDFIFIDGGHSLDTIQNDWSYAKQLMGDRTIVVFDDYYEDRGDYGCKNVIEAIDTSEFRVRVLPQTDTFQKPSGKLRIHLAVVSKRTPASDELWGQTGLL